MAKSATWHDLILCLVASCEFCILSTRNTLSITLFAFGFLVGGLLASQAPAEFLGSQLGAAHVEWGGLLPTRGDSALS